MGCDKAFNFVAASFFLIFARIQKYFHTKLSGYQCAICHICLNADANTPAGFITVHVLRKAAKNPTRQNTGRIYRLIYPPANLRAFYCFLFSSSPNFSRYALMHLSVISIAVSRPHSSLTIVSLPSSILYTLKKCIISSRMCLGRLLTSL